MVEYIVLRDRNWRGRGQRRTGRGALKNVGPEPAEIPRSDGFEPVAKAPEADLFVEHHNLSEKEAAEIENAEDVAGLALDFPTLLPERIDDLGDDIGMSEGDFLAEARANGSTWGVHETGAFESNFNGAGVRVAILDTGIDAAHAAFNGAIGAIADFTAVGANGVDFDGHGTHCAGTALGRNVDGVRIGVAPGATALIGKVIGPGAGTKALIDGISWALSKNAQVISMSLGFDFRALENYLMQHGLHPNAAFGRALKEYGRNLRVIETLVQFAATQRAAGLGGGALFVCATGNASRRKGVASLPAPPYAVPATAPAAAAEMIAIGAVQKQNDGGNFEIAPFSNSDAVLVGPGVGIVSANRGGGLVVKAGTSMACPHVAGLAALWWQREMQNGAADPLIVKSRLLNGARLNRITPPVDVGFGLAMAP